MKKYGFFLAITFLLSSCDSDQDSNFLELKRNGKSWSAEAFVSGTTFFDGNTVKVFPIIYSEKSIPGDSVESYMLVLPHQLNEIVIPDLITHSPQPFDWSRLVYSKRHQSEAHNLFIGVFSNYGRTIITNIRYDSLYYAGKITIEGTFSAVLLDSTKITDGRFSASRVTN